MLRTAFVLGLTLLAAPALVTVGFGPGGATIDGIAVSSSDLQMHDTVNGHVLASKDSVEPLGGPVDVYFPGGKILTMDPGIRLSLVDGKYQLSTHGGKPLFLVGVDGTVVPETSPATIEPASDGWLVNGTLVSGNQLGSALSAPPARPVPPPVVPPGEERLDVRRVSYIDPRPDSEPTDEQTLKNVVHIVSDAGF